MKLSIPDLKLANLKLADFAPAKLKKQWQARSAVAVTIQEQRMAVGLVRRDNGSTRVVESFALPITAAAVLQDAAKAGAELGAALENAGIRERRCVLCVPPGWALAASAELPPVSPEDLRGYLELRAEREFPIPAADLRLAHSSYALPDGKRRATLAAVPNRRMEAVEQMLDAANLRAVSISPGLDDCLHVSEPPSAIHFFVNGDHVDVVVTAGGGIAALRSLPGPLASGDTVFDPVSFCREVRITLGRLPEEVRRQVRQARFGDSPATALLCWQIRENLQRMGIDSPPCAPPPDTDADEPMTASLEPVERHLFERPIAFEFLVSQPTRWETMVRRFDSKRRRAIIAAVAAFIVLPLLVFFVRSRIESGLTAEWNGMRKGVTELEATQLKLRQFRPWFEPVPQTLQIMEGLITAFPEQGDVWAKAIEISEQSKVTCSGFARNQAALATLLDRLRGRADVFGLQVQQVRGENPVQFSVTYKWEARHAD